MKSTSRFVIIYQLLVNICYALDFAIVFNLMGEFIGRIYGRIPTFTKSYAVEVLVMEIILYTILIFITFKRGKFLNNKHLIAFPLGGIFLKILAVRIIAMSTTLVLIMQLVSYSLFTTGLLMGMCRDVGGKENEIH